VVVAVNAAWLLARFGSIWDALTWTVVVAVPAVSWLTIKLTVAVAPLPNTPTLQLIVVPAEQNPEDGVAETSTPVEGRSAVSATSDAVAGPAFEMVAR
jgi:hypothetical protein